MNREVWLGIAVVGEGAPRDRYTSPASLDEAQDAKGLGQGGIAVVRHARLIERLRSDSTVGTARAGDLDTIVEPGDAHGGVGRLVRAVHHRVANELLQRAWRVGLSPCLDWPVRELHDGAVVSRQLVVDALQHVPDRGLHATLDLTLKRHRDLLRSGAVIRTVISPDDPMHIHGHHFRITATDGEDIPLSAQWPETTVLVAVGQREDPSPGFYQHPPGTVALMASDSELARDGIDVNEVLANRADRSAPFSIAPAAPGGGHRQ